MSGLIHCRELSKTYWEIPLFEGVSVNVGLQDRIGVIGANGSGKTTLLRILAGLEAPDSGERIARKGLRIGFVPQDNIFDPENSVEQVVLAAAGWDLASTQEEQTDRRVRTAAILCKMGYADPSQKVRSLSGGWQKRLALAAALVIDPDVLLLDEPTNHLDLEGVLWLENLLQAARFAYIIVSHDRAFLHRCSNRVMELDRRYPGGILSVEGDYGTFLEKREAMRAARVRQRESLSVKVRNEVDWLRGGVKARSTKAKARIDEAHKLIEELESMKKLGATGRVAIDFTATGRKSKRLLTATSLGKSLGGRRLFGGLNLLLRPGLRLGLVGANGSGKTTLLRILAGEIDPDEGRIERVQNLRVVYFDQQREQLDTELPLRRALAEKGDTVIFRDRPIHVGAWAARFRFQTDQLDMRVERLSGGERAKILIARLMLKPADVLLLDEPTNDLDISTLEVLEESLIDFPGALVMVTHDRYLLDRTSTVVLGLDGRGGAEFFADYEQWETALLEKKRPDAPKKPAAQKTRAKSAPTKLSWSEQREYDGMEAAIEQAEAQLEQARREMDDPAVVSDAEKLQQRFEALQAAKARLEALYERWYELESKKQALQRD